MNILVVCNDHVQIHIVMFVSKDLLEMTFFFLLVHTEVNHLPWNTVSRTEESKSGFENIMYQKGFESKKYKPENCCCV